MGRDNDLGLFRKLLKDICNVGQNSGVEIALRFFDGNQWRQFRLIEQSVICNELYSTVRCSD